MATRRAATNAAVQTLADMNDNKVAALIPVNSKGETVNVDGDDWRMPTGSDLETYNGGQDHDEEDATPQTPADRVLSMLAEVEDDQRAYVKVSRVIQGKASWCEDYSAATFEAGGYKMIRDMWGPGEYQVILYGTIPGTKRFTIRTRATVQIEAPLKSATPDSAPVSELGQLVQQLAANQQEMMRVLTERPAPPDPMVQMTQMFSMMKLMREAMGTDTPKPTNGLGDIVNAIKQLREVNEEINPPREPESPLGMVSKMLPLIQAGMAARPPAAQPQPQPQARPNPRPAVSLPAPVNATPNPSPEPTDMNLSEIMKQKGYLATITQMGRDNMPVEEAAEFVYENLSDDLIDALGKDEWFDLLKNIVSGDIEPQREWFTQVRNLALSMFDEPENQGDDGPTPAQNNQAPGAL